MLDIPDTLISWFLPICGINRYNLKITEEEIFIITLEGC